VAQASSPLLNHLLDHKTANMANCKAFCLVFLALLALASFANAGEADAESGESGRQPAPQHHSYLCNMSQYENPLVATHPHAAGR
jgi:hypothetical protein